jgi:molybdopterin molybdotransferase
VTSPPTLTPLDVALAALLSTRGAVPPRRLPLADAVGKVLAEDVVALAPVPAATVALIDGHAVASLDLAGASPYAPAVLPALPPFVRIGEALPPGCDAVLPADAVTVSGALAEVGHSPAPGENARRAGEDGAPGHLIRGAGLPFRPVDALIAREAGSREAAIRPATLLVRADGPIVPWSEALLAGLPGVEVLIDTASGARDPGGSGPDPDLVVLVGRSGTASGLALREAEDAGIAPHGRTPVITAAARPSALAALSLALVRPFFAALTGQPAQRAGLRGPLLRKAASRVGLTEVVLIRDRGDGIEPLSVGTLPLAALAQADGYLLVGPESEGLAEGSIVEAACL